MPDPQGEPLYSQLLVAGRSAILKGQRRARLSRAVAAAELDVGTPGRVLDLGCGDGILWPLLSGHVGRIIGLNYDDWRTRHCVRSFPDGVVLRGDASRLPFAPESFDLVFCLEVFYYLAPKDRITGIAELKRVLRPGGRLVLTVPIEVGLPGAIKFVARVLTRGCWPNAATHSHMLWRRILYRVVEMKEHRRRTAFHFNAYDLFLLVQTVFGSARLQRIPYYYPFVTTALIVADKST